MNNRTIRLGGFYRSLPMLVAEEKGFYSRFDIEMEFGQVSSSTQQFEFLADGRYDIVQTSPDNTANYRLNDDNPIGRRVDARGFLGLDYGMLLVLVARPEIESIGDLRGEVVSVDAPASGFAFVVYEILRNHGLERGRDYDIVPTGGVYDRYLAMVEEGADFAATLMSGGFETRAAERGFRLLDSVHDLYDAYLGVWAAARTEWLAENDQLAVDFVRAYLAASEWVFDPANKAECLDMLKRVPGTSDELAEKLYEIQVRPRVGNVRDGSIDPEAVRNVLQMRARFDGFEQPQDIDRLVGPDTDLFDLSYLARATAE